MNATGASDARVEQADIVGPDSIPVVFPQRVGDLTVELVGYTDTKGAREYNYSLSQRRVDAVRRFLVEKGVQPSRIQAVGLGPLADPVLPEAQKRRVSARLLVDQH